MPIQIGPLRCWPGGLCLSQSLGDMNVGEFKVPVPYVEQVRDNTPPPACFGARSKWSSFERYGDEERRKAYCKRKEEELGHCHLERVCDWTRVRFDVEVVDTRN